MSIKPFIETNPAIDEYVPDLHRTARYGVGLFTLNGWCVIGVEYLAPTTILNSLFGWSISFVVCNIAVGLWNDPD